MNHLHAQHLAHKQRLARIAASAIAAGTVPAPAPVVVRKSVPEMRRIKPMRRQYDTPRAHISNAPIAWRIKRAAADEFGITVDELTGRDQHKKFVTARFVAVGLFLKLTEMSSPAIGRQLGKRDHTTILHSIRQITRLLESEAFANRFDQIKETVR